MTIDELPPSRRIYHHGAEAAPPQPVEIANWAYESGRLPYWLPPMPMKLKEATAAGQQT